MKLSAVFAALALLCAAPSHADQLRFEFDFETAKTVSTAISSGNFDQAAALCEQSDGKAMIRKMQLKDCDGLTQWLKKLRNSQKVVRAATTVAAELSQPGYGRYAPLAAEVRRQIKEYVPTDFGANIRVHFIFGSTSGGFAFDDVRDDVYVDLLYSEAASTQELAEMVAHELFHAVQFHVMRAENLPRQRGAAASTGPVWLNHLLVHLEQEGTAELFTHPLAERPVTPYSNRRYLGIARNANRIGDVVTMFETLGWRMRLAPPDNEDAYDRIYGLMFTTDFDETAYDLGWLMATTIIKHDGKAAIFEMLKQPPKNFVLRYQALAKNDDKLPVFSADFLKEVEALQ
ncbi:hypothetical protein GJ699_06690 [Duganella sp. FT80W]|uniref:DUF2268 domain-containing protein n=1 Tax=Duganella guangzhouensis TaxID=2666084 RepID=A0A6I2KUJ9_9BURK|nr:DUF5700 domain-containing putative Zn-dependent protease [Duganella guangzhouensis]MRW89665.1 hypothetical protein [Duganella guangzhouensis]